MKHLKIKPWVGVFSILLLASALPLLAGSGELIEPEAQLRVEPCCESRAGEGISVKQLIDAWQAPDHSRFDRDVVDRLKAESLVSKAVSRGQALEQGELGAKAAGRTPRIVQSFEGLDIVRSGHEGHFVFPPDTIVAASRTQVIEATNIALRLSGRDGADPQVRSLNDFFGTGLPPSFTDPKIYYDRLSERFFLVAIGRRGNNLLGSRLYVSVSRSADPQTLDSPADWCNYNFKGRVLDTAPDYPGLGVSEDWLAITTNQYRCNGRRCGFWSAYLWAIEKSSLVDNAESCPALELSKIRIRDLDRSGAPVFTLQPAQHYDRSGIAGRPLFLLANGQAGFVYGVFRLETGPSGRPIVRSSLHAARHFTRYPPDAPQRNGLALDTGDTRVTQAAFRGGQLWGVHATACQLGEGANESCVQVIAFEPDDEGAEIVFEETLGGGPDWFYWWPGVAINARGDVVVVFQRGREGGYFGTGYAGKRANDPGFGSTRRLERGRCPLDNWNGSVNRTGDYVGAQADPADDRSFWIAGEFPTEIQDTCSWHTGVARVR